MPVSLHVLLLEDNPSDAELMLAELRRAGFEPDWKRVETEADFLAALDPALELILADYKLPQFDGLRALDLLLERNLDIPFILVSGKIGEELAVSAITRGAADYLLKDRLARLGTAVLQALKHREVQQKNRLAEATLRESEERYRSLFETALDAILLTAPDGSILAANSSACRMFERTEEEIIRVGRSGIVDTSDPRLATGLKERDRTGIFAGELTLLRKDGTKFPAELSTSLFKDKDGLVRTSMVIRDITERKRVEQALAESETRFKWLYEYAPVAYQVLTPEGTITDVNRRWCELLGYRREEALGKAIFDFVVEEEREAAKASFEKKKQSKQPYVEGSERHFRTKAGTVRTCKTYDFFTLDAAENINSVQTTMEDITERRRAEEALRESENRLRTLFAGMTDVVIVYDADGRYLEIAPTQTVNFRQPASQMLGKTVSELFPPDEARFFLDHIRHALETGKLENAEYRIRFGAQDRWFSAAVSPLSSNSVIWVAHDITLRKQAEQRIRRQLEHLTALSEIDRAIASTVDVKVSLSVLLTHIVKELGVDAAAVLLLSPGVHVLEYVGERGFHTKAIETARVRLGEGHAGRAALERRMVAVPSLELQPDDPLLTTLLAGEGFVSYYGVPLTSKGNVTGVLELFHRSPLEPDPEWFDFLKTLAGQAAIAIDSSTLFDGLQRSNVDLSLAYDATIAGWSHALDLRDNETEGHTQRVTDMALSLARLFGLRDEELVHLRRGGLLHDIGKMGVPDGILFKPGPLTDEEWVVMKKHPVFAYDMLSPIQYLHSALDIPYCHHEKWDGTGYPRGLKGEQIPLTARLFAVVDVWDALISDRPYRKAWTPENTLEYIRTQAGTHFDPQVVKVFLESDVIHDQKTERPPDRQG